MTISVNGDSEQQFLNALGLDERVLLRCAVAHDFVNTGMYEAAREALGELWQGIGQRPQLVNLSPHIEAEVLLQCGTLTGWLGSTRNVPGAQEQAKDMLSEAVRNFRAQRMLRKASEAQFELGMCYWRLGALDECRVVLREALKPLTDADVELKAKVYIRQTIVEVWENRYYEALTVLKEAEPVFESANDVLKGRWHSQKALVLRGLAAEGRADYFDRAIIEYTAAIYHYEQAGHESLCGTNLNNLAFLLFKLGRYREAYEHLDRAQLIFMKLGDVSSLAHLDETRAQILLAECRLPEAEAAVRCALNVFEEAKAQVATAEALLTLGVILKRAGEEEGAKAALIRSNKIGLEAGALHTAGNALLTMIEELSEQLERDELVGAYEQAYALLIDSQQPETLARLLACAQQAVLSMKRIQVMETRPLRVFLCHSKSDKVAVRELYRRLKAETIDPWFDEEKLLPGQDWNAEITKAVQETDAVIVCLTHASTTKAGYVQKEIQYALDAAYQQPEGTIFLIPLKLEECKVPKRLQTWQWVNYFEADGFSLLMRSLRERALSLSSLAPKE